MLPLMPISYAGASIVGKDPGYGTKKNFTQYLPA
jgi:hypothetical protein